MYNINVIELIIFLKVVRGGMNLKQFQYVLALADKGNFSRAAEELGVSQPSLSQYIKRLEADLGVTLFDRSNGDVRLTDAGRVYIDAGKTVIDTERQMQSRFADLNDHRAGSLVVGIAPTRCQYLMPEAVTRFHRVYPGMHLVIEERFLGSLLEDAERGAFDLCVATLPVDTGKFSFDLMMREEVILAVPRALPVYNRLAASAVPMPDRLYPAVDITALRGAPYVCLTETQPTQKQLASFRHEFGFEVEIAARCMSIETQYSLVKAGAGLALLPSSIAKYSADTSVAFFSVRQEIPERDMAVIYRKNQYLSKAARALRDILVSL